MKYLMRFVIIVGLFVVFSCHRRPLEEEYIDKAKLPVNIFWQKARYWDPIINDSVRIKVHNASLLIYDESGNLYLEKVFSSNDSVARTEILLDPGKFTIFAFNEKRDQIDYVRFRGVDKLEKLEAYIVDASNIVNFENTNNVVMVEKPGMLAVSKSEVEITKQMIISSWSSNHSSENKYSDSSDGHEAIMSLSRLYPLLKTSLLCVRSTVDGLNNARMPALLEMINLAEGYNFSSDCNTLNRAGLQTTINNRIYLDDINGKGTISTSATCFGVLGNRHNINENKDNRLIYNLHFKLIDENSTLHSYTNDVTNEIEIEEDLNKAISLHLNTIHSRLPDVIPSQGESSGFETELVDWIGENINIEL